jgi:NADH-quinone oxidoreductase subunit M
VFHGEPDEANKKFREISFKEGAVLLPFLAAIVFMGVYPKPVLDRIEPSIDKLISHVEAHTDYVEPEPTIEIGVVPEAPAEGEHSESGDAEEGE